MKNNKIISISFRAIFLFLCGLLLTAKAGVSQNISPEDQEKITAINTWVQAQIAKGNIPTQTQIDSINKAVKEKFQAEANSIKTAADSNNTDTLKTKAVVIRKQCMVGSSLTVPVNKIWKVKRVFVTDGIGGGYNILVGSIKYEKPLNAGEKLSAPVWAAESNLIGGNDSTQLIYIFEIEESDAGTK